MEIEIENDILKHTGTPQMYDGDPNGSGRYRQGSGDNPNQHHVGDFIDRIDDFKRKGLKSEKEIWEAMGITSTEYRKRKQLANEERRAALSIQIKDLYYNQGVTNKSEIARQLGIGESKVRDYLKTEKEIQKNITQSTTDFLREQVNAKKMVEVGEGVERELGISKEKFAVAKQTLVDEGYNIYNAKVEQMTNPGKFTTITVLATPETTQKEVYSDKFGHIQQLNDYTSYDDGETFKKSFQYPVSLDSKRIAIRYAEEGGVEQDGLIEIRRGCKDIELDGSTYSQVRILVDGTHYMKGMAAYSDDVPEGKDIVFNTNKHIGTPALGEDKNNTVLKHIKKDDPENPFGSAIKEKGGQHYYYDENGEPQLSVINKRSDEGDWGNWSSSISAQMLSKQPQKLISQQLNISKINARNEFDELKELTNPVIKKNMLLEYADNCDKAAIELKAAAFANTKYQVILPLRSISDEQVYAPNYTNGSQVALIRYPHAGTFEIPILTVNNNNKEGIDRITPSAKDAVGISSKVAERLSGADFDGDTVMVIPITEKSQIKSTKALKQLEGFDPKALYKATETWTDDKGVFHCKRGDIEFKPMTTTDKEMGMVSNLITDMTIKGAPVNEIARAVRHSMVVIDAEKHNLDYKASYKAEGIEELKRKWQGKFNEETGNWNYPAATIVSSASSTIRVPEFKEGGLFDRSTNDPVMVIERDKYHDPVYINTKTGEYISKGKVKTVKFDPQTGEKLYHQTNRTFLKAEVINDKGKKENVSVWQDDKTGEYVYRLKGSNEIKKIKGETIKTEQALSDITKMQYYKDAYALSSGTKVENAYADYANYMKSLANQARLETMTINFGKRDKDAYKEYEAERKSIDEKLNKALLNAPKERMAQIIASNQYHVISKDNPHMDKDEIKKLKQRLIVKAREQVGASRKNIQLTDKEWEAIQKGAISPTKLDSMYKYMDKDKLRDYATPKNTVALSDAKVRTIQSMANNGYTNAEIASRLGVSVTTIVKYKGGNE